MKIKNIITICYILLNIIIIVNSLPTDQNDAAIELLEKIRSVTTTTPCGAFIICNIDQSTVVGISFSSVSNNVVLNTDFSVFKDVKSISLGSNIYANNILDNLTQLTKLTTLKLGTHNSTYNDNSLVLPSSLTSIQIDYTTIQIGINFFKSKTLKTLIIGDCKVGYQLPSTFPAEFPTMDSLETLVTPVISGSNFPNNIETIMPNLTSLTLYVISSKTRSPSSFDFPTLNKMKSLTQLVIYFVLDPLTADQYHTWAFPSILTNISSELTSLVINGPSFTTSTSNNGNLDFSSYKEGFILTFFGPFYESIAFEDRCNYISTCTSKSCLVLPKDTSLNLYSCSIDLNQLDLSNVTMIDVSDNPIEQTLPTTIQYDQMKAIKFRNSKFTGQLPQSICNFPIYENTAFFSLSNNNFNGKILSCFSCRGPQGITNLMFPNSWDDFTPTSEPTNCPTRLLNDTKVIALTDSSTTITLTGQDFGWVAASPKFNILIPNKLMTVNLEQGVGKDHEISTLVDNGYTYTLNYNYEKPVITSFAYDFETKVFTLYGYGFDYLAALSFVKFNNDTNKVFYSNKAVKSNNGRDEISGSNLYYIFNDIKVGDQFNVTVEVGGQISDPVTFTFGESGSTSIDTSSSGSQHSSNDNEDSSSVNSTSKLFISNLFILILISILL